MLDKCANPCCMERFLYLGKGRLFRVECNHPAAESSLDATKRERVTPQYFWLCAKCATKFTVAVDRNQVVHVIPCETIVPDGAHELSVIPLNCGEPK